MTIKKMVVLATVMATVGVYAAKSDMVVSDGAIKPGEWNSNFTAAKAYAESNKTPMLVFWSGTGCGFCSKLRAACKTDAFVNWQAQKKYVMVYQVGETTNEGKQCKSFAKNSSGGFPYVALYWVKQSGGTVLQKFTGRSGSMPVKTGTLAEQLMNSADAAFAGWNSSSDTDSEEEADPVTPTDPQDDAKDDTTDDDAKDDPTPVVTDKFVGNANYIALYYSSAEKSGTPEGVITLKAGKASSSGNCKLTGKIQIVTGDNAGKSYNLASKTVSLTDSYVDADLEFKRFKTIRVTIKATSITGDQVCSASNVKLNSGSYKFDMESPNGVSLPKGYDLIEELVPTEYSFTVSDKKLNFGGKPTVKYVKSGNTYVLTGATDAKPNVSRMAISYAGTSGFLKGTCYIYASNAATVTGRKPTIKKYSCKVYGCVCDGVARGIIKYGKLKISEFTIQ